MNEVLRKGDGDMDEIQEVITPHKLTKCTTNSLEKSLEVSYRLKTLANAQGPDADDFKSLATSVEDFAVQLLEPLKYDDMKRTIFEGDDFDRILDKSVLFQQKKFVSHPVVYNLLKGRWIGRYHNLKYSSWMESQRYKWLLLNVWAVVDTILFPVAFTLLYFVHLLIGWAKKRQEIRVVMVLNASWKYASKEYKNMQALCRSIMGGDNDVDNKVQFAFITRLQNKTKLENQLITHVHDFQHSETAKEILANDTSNEYQATENTVSACLESAKQLFGHAEKHSKKVLLFMTDDTSGLSMQNMDKLKGFKETQVHTISVSFGVHPEIKKMKAMATNEEDAILFNGDVKVEKVSQRISKKAKNQITSQLLKYLSSHNTENRSKHNFKMSNCFIDRYIQYFTTPYFIFLRDTLSYLVLLGLHFAMCIQPSTLHFTALEWLIMLFFLGRFIMEVSQVITEKNSNCFPEVANIRSVSTTTEREKDSGENEQETIARNDELLKEEIVEESKKSVILTIMSRYFSDWWNGMDVLTLTVYCILVIMRFITWAEHITVCLKIGFWQ
ncbi:hypothetical protein QZH41_018383 [Actinostola sp. cb2023]|nr:hypothetical protein QZH41_018383 [Actinostola sp. cb2023]